jgi:cyclopropane fatty-acyl-phospholipid synthase-like methyltransferase
VNELMPPKYILGHSQEEIRRLMAQTAILRPFTDRLLRNAEIGPGMRVLDLGCGPGDVSMLAAELSVPRDRLSASIAMRRSLPWQERARRQPG